MTWTKNTYNTTNNAPCVFFQCQHSYYLSKLKSCSHYSALSNFWPKVQNFASTTQKRSRNVAMAINQPQLQQFRLNWIIWNSNFSSIFIVKKLVWKWSIECFTCLEIKFQNLLKKAKPAFDWIDRSQFALAVQFKWFQSQSCWWFDIVTIIPVYSVVQLMWPNERYNQIGRPTRILFLIRPEHRGSVHAPHPAALGSILGIPIIHSLNLILILLRLIDGTA